MGGFSEEVPGFAWKEKAGGFLEGLLLLSHHRLVPQLRCVAGATLEPGDTKETGFLIV